MKLPFCPYKNLKITNLEKRKKKAFFCSDQYAQYQPKCLKSAVFKPVQNVNILVLVHVLVRYIPTNIYIYIYLYGLVVSRPLWGLSPNLITPSPSPGLTPPSSPFGQMISISSHPPPSHPGSYPSTVPREVKSLLGLTVSQLLGSTLGILMPSISAGVGSSSKATPTVLH